MGGKVVVTEDDWSLHRKGYDDQRRHEKKVKEAWKKQLPDLITEENIIMSHGDKMIRIPIRSLNEYKIKYNDEKRKHAGQGDGNSEEGDVLGKADTGGDKGQQAGEEEGKDYYEAEVTISEIEEAVFKHLSLPNLEDKEVDMISEESYEFTDVRKTGLEGNMDKKRTLIEAYKRNARTGSPEFTPILPEDLRYKTWREEEKPIHKAVVLAMMDTSGSMGKWEKYMARSFFFWMTRFLRKEYETVEIEFIAHHTKAKVVTEDDFFYKGESGGTVCSSAYEKALQLIEEKYSPSRYNIYPIHFSDGDNLSSDLNKCLSCIEQLMQKSQLFGYGEVNQYNRLSNLMQSYRKIDDDKFRSYILRRKKDVFYALQAMFSETGEELKVR